MYIHIINWLAIVRLTYKYVCNNTTCSYYIHTDGHYGRHICLILSSLILVDKISNTKNMTPKTTRAIVNFFTFSLAIMHVTLALSNFHFATRFLSNVAAVRTCACFDSSLATSIACSNWLNLAITIGAVAAPRVQQMLVSNHLKNLHAQSSSCTIQYNT